MCLYIWKWGNQPFRGLCCQIYSCPRENNWMVVIDVFGMPVTGILFIKMMGLFLFNLVDAIKDHKRTSWWDSGAGGSAPCSLSRQWLNLNIKCQMLLDNTYHWQITGILRRKSFVQRAQDPSCSPVRQRNHWHVMEGQLDLSRDVQALVRVLQDRDSTSWAADVGISSSLILSCLHFKPWDVLSYILRLKTQPLPDSD